MVTKSCTAGQETLHLSQNVVFLSHIHNSRPLNTSLGQMNPAHTITIYFLNIYLVVVLIFMPMSLTDSLTFKFLQKMFIYVSFSSMLDFTHLLSTLILSPEQNLVYSTNKAVHYKIFSVLLLITILSLRPQYFP